MVVGLEPGLARDLANRARDAGLERGRRGDVLHGATLGADQMMVVFGQMVGEFIAGVVGCDDAVDQPGTLQHLQVPVGGAHRQRPVVAQDLLDREGTARLLEYIDEREAPRRDSLPVGAELCLDPGAQVGGVGSRSHPAMVDSGIGTEDFVALVADRDHEPPLDEGALLIASIATGIDVEGWLARLDELAGAAVDRVPPTDAAALAQLLFVEWGFAGDTGDYGDPRNSLLSEVIDRRRGMPITLSVLMIEVGRRIGVELEPVGMPGHFLVAAPGSDFYDPFHGGAALDRDGARRRFASLHGAQIPFRDDYLAPVSHRQVLLRILTNLQQSYAVRRSRNARWVAQLRLAFPELPDEERARTAEVLVAVGAFRDAAEVLEDAASRLGPTAAGAVTQRARALRSRSN